MLVAWKGARDSDEEARGSGGGAAALGLRSEEVRSVVPFEGARHRHLHVFRKIAATPAPDFRAAPAIARKRPLG